MWYLVMSRQVTSDEQRMQTHPAHIEWLLEQHRAGRVLVSGPTADRGMGMYILVGCDRSEAHALAAQDPYHASGDRRMEIFEWEPQRALRLDASERAAHTRNRSGRHAQIARAQA